MPDCMLCKYSGFDIADGPYCVAPKVLKVAPYGLNLSSRKIAEICPAPEHPLYETRPAPGDVGEAGGAA